MPFTTSDQVGPGPWVGIGPDGAVVPAPYPLGAPLAGPTQPGVASAGGRRRRAGVAAFGTAALGGALAAVAPFLVLWRYSFTNGFLATKTVATGWGAVSAQPASFALGHSHDTNYGLPMALAAVLLLAGAGTYLFTRRAAVAALPTSAGASLAAGAALLLMLDRGGRDSASSGSDAWGVGPGFWLIVIAGGLGVLVAVAVGVLAALELRAGAHPPAFAPAGPPAALPLGADQTNTAWSGPLDPNGEFVPRRQPQAVPEYPAEFAPPWAP